MTFEFKPDVRYRMPVMFGPAPGPRQKHDGTPWQPEESGVATVQWATLGYRTHRHKAEALLPSGFELNGDPIVYVTFGFFRNLYWLAGRGYGIVNAELPVVYTGKDETITGGLCLAIWEGRPDAVTTGREELGFPKLFADIPDGNLDPDSGSISGEASWLDFTFFEMEMHGFERVPAGDMVLPGAPGGPIHYKYMPRTGPFGTAGADVTYVTTSQPKPGESAGSMPIKFDDADFKKWKGTGGSVTWHRATFEQLPTSCHVVNGIADLDILEYVSAEMIEFSAPGNAVATNSHRAVEPA
ncbi:MAG: acetoacetate decarboxylase family protein [Acidimicrobiales bacterium]